MLEVSTQAMRLVLRAQEPFEPAQQEQLSFATVLAPRVSTEATVATWVASHFGLVVRGLEAAEDKRSSCVCHLPSANRQSPLPLCGVS